MIKTTYNTAGNLESIPALIAAFEEIAREMHRLPNDSVVDVLNDAFISHDISLEASWTDDDLDPVRVRPNTSNHGK